MSFLLKAYVFYLGDINSLRLSGCLDSRVCKPYKGCYVIFVPCNKALLPKTLRSSSYGVCLSLKTNGTALSFIFFFQFPGRTFITEVPGLCTGNRSVEQ